MENGAVSGGSLLHFGLVQAASFGASGILARPRPCSVGEQVQNSLGFGV